MSMTINAETIREQFNAEAAKRASGGGSSIEYLRLGAGQNEIRLLPSDPLFIYVPLHAYKVDGKFYTSLDYREVLNNLDIQRMATERGWLDEEDVKLASKYGDPFIRLAEQAISLGVDSDAVSKAKLWPKHRYFWNALDVVADDGVVRLFESSRQFFNDVKDNILPKFPDVFQMSKGRNIGIAGNGKDGFQRRYSSPMPDPELTTVDVDEGNFVDLLEAAARKVRKYREKVDHLLKVHGALATELEVHDFWTEIVEG